MLPNVIIAFVANVIIALLKKEKQSPSDMNGCHSWTLSWSWRFWTWCHCFALFWWSHTLSFIVLHWSLDKLLTQIGFSSLKKNALHRMLQTRLIAGRNKKRLLDRKYTLLDCWTENSFVEQKNSFVGQKRLPLVNCTFYRTEMSQRPHSPITGSACSTPLLDSWTKIVQLSNCWTKIV